MYLSVKKMLLISVNWGKVLIIEQGIEILLKDKPELLGACLNAIYRDLEGEKIAEEFHRRHMTPSCGVITVYDIETVKKIITPLVDKICNKVVVEVGAGEDISCWISSAASTSRNGRA